MSQNGILKRAIESVKNQTFRDYELILVNDGSTDDSGEIVDRYVSEDSRMIAIHKQNEGCYQAYNDGLDRAQGEYVTFFNSDDYADLDMYEELCARCKTLDLDYLLTSLWLDKCDSQGQVISIESYGEIAEDCFYEQEQFRETYEKYKNFKSNNLHLYRRALVGDLRFKTRHFGEDCIFNLHFVPRVNRALYCAQPYYHLCNYSSELFNISVNKFHPKMQVLFSERFFLAKKNLLDWGFYEGENKHIVARRRIDDLLLQYRLLDAPSCHITSDEKKHLALAWIDDSVIDAAYDLLVEKTLIDVILRAKHRQLDGGNPSNVIFLGEMVSILARAIPALCHHLKTINPREKSDVKKAFLDIISNELYNIIAV